MILRGPILPELLREETLADILTRAATDFPRRTALIWHDGKVIGIFTLGSVYRETLTYAVPIKYGIELFKVQRSQN